MTDAIKLTVQRVEKYIAERERMRGLDKELIHGLHSDDPREAELLASDLSAMVAALRAQPAEPFKKLSDAQVLWLAESHGIDVYASNPLAFYADLISTTPAQPDHSELVKELRLTIGRDRVDDDDNVALVPRWIVEQAADALEGKAIGGKA